jgi:hypothetical protein
MRKRPRLRLVRPDQQFDLDKFKTKQPPAGERKPAPRYHAPAQRPIPRRTTERKVYPSYTRMVPPSLGVSSQS